MYLSGELSATVVIPINLARKYKIDKPANIIIEDNGNGVLIRKLEIGQNKNLLNTHGINCSLIQ